MENFDEYPMGSVWDSLDTDEQDRFKRIAYGRLAEFGISSAADLTTVTRQMAMAIYVRHLVENQASTAGDQTLEIPPMVLNALQGTSPEPAPTLPPVGEAITEPAPMLPPVGEAIVEPAPTLPPAGDDPAPMLPPEPTEEERRAQMPISLAFTEGGGTTTIGGGTIAVNVSDWALIDNDDPIPANKLTNAPSQGGGGLSLSEVQAEVEQLTGTALTSARVSGQSIIFNRLNGGSFNLNISGLEGPQGIQGPQGPPGADGADGAQGPRGLQGPQGPAGQDGAQGPPGADGEAVSRAAIVPSTLPTLSRTGTSGPWSATITIPNGMTLGQIEWISLSFDHTVVSSSTAFGTERSIGGFDMLAATLLASTEDTLEKSYYVYATSIDFYVDLRFTGVNALTDNSTSFTIEVAAYRGGQTSSVTVNSITVNSLVFIPNAAGGGGSGGTPNAFTTISNVDNQERVVFGRASGENPLTLNLSPIAGNAIRQITTNNRNLILLDRDGNTNSVNLEPMFAGLSSGGGGLTQDQVDARVRAVAANAVVSIGGNTRTTLIFNQLDGTRLTANFSDLLHEDEVAIWAKAGNTNQIPVSRATLILTEANTQARGQVQSWARLGDTSLIPANKLPTSSGGGSLPAILSDGSAGHRGQILAQSGDTRAAAGLAYTLLNPGWLGLGTIVTTRETTAAQIVEQAWTDRGDESGMGTDGGYRFDYSFPGQSSQTRTGVHAFAFPFPIEIVGNGATQQIYQSTAHQDGSRGRLQITNGFTEVGTYERDGITYWAYRENGSARLISADQSPLIVYFRRKERDVVSDAERDRIGTLDVAINSQRPHEDPIEHLNFSGEGLSYTAGTLSVDGVDRRTATISFGLETWNNALTGSEAQRVLPVSNQPSELGANRVVFGTGLTASRITGQGNAIRVDVEAPPSQGGQSNPDAFVSVAQQSSSGDGRWTMRFQQDDNTHEDFDLAPPVEAILERTIPTARRIPEFPAGLHYLRTNADNNALEFGEPPQRQRQQVIHRSQGSYNSSGRYWDFTLSTGGVQPSGYDEFHVTIEGVIASSNFVGFSVPYVGQRDFIHNSTTDWDGNLHQIRVYYQASNSTTWQMAYKVTNSSGNRVTSSATGPYAIVWGFRNI